MALKIGDKAPDFALFSSDKEPVKLSSFEGNKNVVLLFFPLAFTGVCTAELCSVRDDIGKYDNEKTTVFGISTDAFATLAAFKEQQNYNYKLLSDYNKEASEAYGTLYDSFTPMQMKGVSKRSAFVVDKEGKIQYAEILENAGEVPNFSAIQEVLKKLN